MLSKVVRKLARVVELFPTWVEWTSIGIGCTLLLGMVSLMLVATFMRYVQWLDPWLWFDEMMVLMMASSVFILLGSPTRRDEHIRLGFIMEWIFRSPQKAERFYTLLDIVIGLGVSTFFAWLSVRWMLHAKGIVFSPGGFTYPLWITRILPMVGMCLISFFYFERAVKRLLGFVASRQQAKHDDAGSAA